VDHKPEDHWAFVPLLFKCQYSGRVAM
jgi:predicted metal-dependent RNase